MILSALAFGEQPDWSDVEVIGIDSISAEQVHEACERVCVTAMLLKWRNELTVKLLQKSVHN